MCTRCGAYISKSSLIDAYMCRWCQVETDFTDLYANLDSKIV